MIVTKEFNNAHFCTPRCLHCISDDNYTGNCFRRKPNNLKPILDNTKHLFFEILMNLTTEFKDILVDIQLRE